MTILETLIEKFPEFSIFRDESCYTINLIEKDIQKNIMDIENKENYSLITVYEFIIKYAIKYSCFEIFQKAIHICKNKYIFDYFHLLWVIHCKKNFINLNEIIFFFIKYVDFSSCSEAGLDKLSLYCIDLLKSGIYIDILIIIENSHMSNDQKNKFLELLFEYTLHFYEFNLYIDLLEYGVPQNFYQVYKKNMKKDFMKEVLNKIFQKFLNSLKIKQNKIKIFHNSKMTFTLPTSIIENIYTMI